MASRYKNDILKVINIIHETTNFENFKLLEDKCRKFLVDEDNIWNLPPE